MSEPAPPRDPPAPKLELMARFEVALSAPPWELGQTSAFGRRRIIPITGGRFYGPLLNGEILDNGADWQIVTDEGLAIIDTRYLLRLSDGGLAYLQTRGFRHGAPDVIAALARGEDVDPGRYYFRVTMHFETASLEFAWLNRTLGLGSAIRRADAVVYDAYAVR
jgi:Protein of unknown function (DUF3237)